MEQQYTEGGILQAARTDDLAHVTYLLHENADLSVCDGVSLCHYHATCSCGVSSSDDLDSCDPVVTSA